MPSKGRLRPVAADVLQLRACGETASTFMEESFKSIEKKLTTNDK